MVSALKSGLRFAAALLIVCASVATPVDAHKSAGYSHDGNAKTSNPRWMTALKADVTLSRLSLPGTHDTMSFYGGDIAQAQTLSLNEQLQSGVRALDVRCWHNRDTFVIHHGVMPQFATFGEVLKTVVGFLVDNPGETVVMRVKEEFTAMDNTESFEQTFDRAYWAYYKDYFYQHPANSSSDPNNPPLAEMRGKIVLLQNFSNSYGIRYGSDQFDIQDQYNLKSNADLYDKWRAVKTQLESANKGDANKKFINFLSGSGGSFPYFVASGHSSPGTSAPRLATGRTTPGWKSWKDFPRVNCALGICTIAYEGTNVLTYERLGKDFKQRAGIVFADFPGPGLIERTIALNNSFKT